MYVFVSPRPKSQPAVSPVPGTRGYIAILSWDISFMESVDT